MYAPLASAASCLLWPPPSPRMARSPPAQQWCGGSCLRGGVEEGEGSVGGLVRKSTKCLFRRGLPLVGQDEEKATTRRRPGRSMRSRPSAPHHVRRGRSTPAGRQITRRRRWTGEGVRVVDDWGSKEDTWGGWDRVQAAHCCFRHGRSELGQTSTRGGVRSVRLQQLARRRGSRPEARMGREAARWGVICVRSQ